MRVTLKTLSKPYNRFEDEMGHGKSTESRKGLGTGRQATAIVKAFGHLRLH